MFIEDSLQTESTKGENGQFHLDRVVDVAQVKHRSPFRYPGGKTWLVPRVRQWLMARGGVHEFVEPFCGGAIVGLSVAFDGLAKKVTLVELDRQVAAVWQVILQGSDADVHELVTRIADFQMTRANAEQVLSCTPSSTLDQAFVTILKNRVQHGGCLAQGAGLIRNGENGRGIGSRWYPAPIVRRIWDIRGIRERVAFVCDDGIEVLQRMRHNEQAVFFIDPPYWVAGARLYDYSELDHGRLFDCAAALAGDFLMSYDNVEAIRRLAEAQQFDTRLIAMRNKNHQTQKELLIGRDLRWADAQAPQLALA